MIRIIPQILERFSKPISALICVYKIENICLFMDYLDRALLISRVHGPLLALWTTTIVTGRRTSVTVEDVVSCYGDHVQIMFSTGNKLC